jgi:hypothetical protein
MWRIDGGEGCGFEILGSVGGIGYVGVDMMVGDGVGDGEWRLRWIL